MRGKRNKIRERTEVETLAYLNGTQKELSALLDLFDSGETSCSRTLAMLCIRAVDEIRHVDKSRELAFPKGQDDGKYHISRLKTEFRFFKNHYTVKYDLRDNSALARKMLKHAEINASYTNTQNIDAWLSEKILKNSRGKILTRRDFLRLIRNRLGAHYEIDIHEDFGDVEKISLPYEFSSSELSTRNRVRVFTNSAFPYLVRELSWEIEITLKSRKAKDVLLRKLKTSKTLEPEPLNPPTIVIDGSSAFSKGKLQEMRDIIEKKKADSLSWARKVIDDRELL